MSYSRLRILALALFVFAGISELLYEVTFFFNDTATTEIYTLSLHDALPISVAVRPPREGRCAVDVLRADAVAGRRPARRSDRKSTRLNSSHVEISYAVF